MKYALIALVVIVELVALGIYIGITLFEYAVKDAIEGLMGRKASRPKWATK